MAALERTGNVVPEPKLLIVPAGVMVTVKSANALLTNPKAPPAAATGTALILAGPLSLVDLVNCVPVNVGALAGK